VNPYRRFVLLFAFALAALFSVAIMTQRSTNQHAVAEAKVNPTKALISPPARSVTGVAVSFPSGFRLQPLWSTSLAQRFPRLLPPTLRLEQLTSDRQIISYYGNPYSPAMGILGASDLETIGAKLAKRRVKI